MYYVLKMYVDEELEQFKGGFKGRKWQICTSILYLLKLMQMACTSLSYTQFYFNNVRGKMRLKLKHKIISIPSQ